jgi:hypothetical protein
MYILYASWILAQDANDVKITACQRILHSSGREYRIERRSALKLSDDKDAFAVATSLELGILEIER